MASHKKCNTDLDTNPIGIQDRLMLVSILHKKYQLPGTGYSTDQPPWIHSGPPIKAIKTGPPHKPQALVVHILVDEDDTLPIMKKLNDIYSMDHMKNHASDYPLGQRLLLAPMVKGLNDQNLTVLLQLKAKQASFCNQVVMVTMHAVVNLDMKASFTTADGNHTWSLCSLLMQVEHPTTNTCVFFQAIDNYSTRNRVVFTMLPSAAAYGFNAVLGIIPFTHWLLKPVYGKQQSTTWTPPFTWEPSMTWSW